jgi:hypothetical protein
MIAPAFGCRPLSGKPFAVTAWAPAAHTLHAASRDKQESLHVSPFLRWKA